MLRRWLPLFAVSVALLRAVPACMSDSDDTKLNPQPLPPGAPPDDVASPREETDNSGAGAEPSVPGDVGSTNGDASDATDASDSGG